MFFSIYMLPIRASPLVLSVTRVVNLPTPTEHALDHESKKSENSPL